MTYSQLLNILSTIPKDRLEDTITIYDKENEEYYPIYSSEFSNEKDCDVRDHGHLILIRE